MIKKLLRYLLLLLTSLVLLLGVSYYYLIHTEGGGRVLIDFAVDYTGTQLEYSKLSGTVADGLQFHDVKYIDELTEINIEQFSYQAHWSMLNRYIDFSLIDVEQLDILIKQSDKSTGSDQNIESLTWPLELNIELLDINQLTIHGDQWSQTIKQLQLTAAARNHSLTVEKLHLDADGYNWQVDGSVDTKEGLSYQLQSFFNTQIEQQKYELNGSITGDLNTLQFEQKITAQQQYTQGEFKLQGTIKNLTSAPIFQLELLSEDASITWSEQTISVNQLKAKLLGPIDNYQIVLDASLTDQQQRPTQISMEATGDTSQLSSNKTQIITQQGSLRFTGGADWQNQLSLNGSIAVADINPEQWFPQWSGHLNGMVNLALIKGENGLEINSQNNQLQGELKGQPVAINGALTYAKDTIHAHQIQLKAGNNEITANGEITPEQVDMQILGDLSDLSLFNSDWSGQINGKLDISGNYQNPELAAELLAQDWQVNDIKIDSLQLNSQGFWGQSLTTTLHADSLMLNHIHIDQIDVKQSGWLNNHHVSASITHHQIKQELEFSGSLEPTNQHWSGLIEKHQISDAFSRSFSLQEPVTFSVNDRFQIEAACWQGIEQGSLCLELAGGGNQPYSGNIKLEDLSLQFLKFWLPDQTDLIGQVNGNLEFVSLSNDLQITSDLQVNDGVLNISQHQGEEQYQTVIKTMQLTAHSNQTSTGVSFELVTDKNDFLNIEGNITKAQGEWLIEGSVNGNIEHIELISQLSNEINYISGSFKLEGEISGKLKQPVIKLEFQQSDGFIQFSRLGTLVENLNVKVVTENFTQPEYKIKISGQNLTNINQGTFDIDGSLRSFNQNWQFQGRINGDNFMVLNTPELKLNTSPKLSISANQNTMSITGDLFIEQGHISIKQLPPETESNSNDLIIHQPDDLPENHKYTINWDINTQIRNQLKLDVIGLQADLTGAIQLKQLNNKALQANGTLNLEEGVYEIYGQKLTINNGELFFNGSIDNPRLDVKASRKSLDESVVAGVQLGGTVNRLQSQLFSEPLLSDIEILSYITTGRGISQAGSVNAEQLTQAAILLGLNQGTAVFQEIQNTFGIDVLTIKESANTADTVIEAGKRINDKIYVSYNQGIFNRLGFWVLKYKINEFLNLQTTQGEDQSIELLYTRKAEVKPDNSK